MKTTVEIPDDLATRAKSVAAAEGSTLRALIVEGLRQALANRKRGSARFTLRDATVGGRGVQKGLREGNWDELRDLIYQGRGS